MVLLKIINPKCSYMTNPIGTDDNISFSWQLESAKKGTVQAKYRIIAKENGELIWDTGIVASDEQTSIVYEGKKLKSRQRIDWKVIVEDNFQNKAESENAFFETALLSQRDWKAKWIINSDVHDLYGNIAHERPLPSYLFRKEFELHKKVKAARIYVCGLGFFTMKINGEKVSDEVLAPGYTRYDKRTLYCTYDVTNYLTEHNAIGITLGNGRYNGFAEGVWDLRCEPWRGTPKLIAQLYIDYTDGSTDIIMTDKSWKTDMGSAVFNCLHGGEHYDARLEQPGWDTFGFDSNKWTDVEISRGSGGLLFPSNYPPIRITESFAPVQISKTDDGKLIYDFGQNSSGWIKIKVSGKAGAQLLIRTAEIFENGGIDLQNIDHQYKEHALFQLDQYTLRGNDIEEWEPAFTYHGFRYAQISGDLSDIVLIDICAQCVHTDLKSYGRFECSNELLNKIHHLCIWATKTNYHSIPTDCPTREKRGWTGDAVMSAEQALFNFDMNAAYTKWLNDFEDCQRENGQIPGIIPTGYWGYNWGNGPAWDAALILIPWYMYTYTRNKVILKKAYPMMLNYMEFLETMADHYILGFGLGDWNSPDFGKGYKYPIELSDTAFYLTFAKTLSKIAKVLDKKGDIAKFNQLAKNIKTAARNAFIGEDGKVKGECQTAYSVALCFGLCDDQDELLVVDRLEKDIQEHNFAFDFGHFGCKFVFEALSRAGRYDTAYKLATSNMYPSFGWMLEQGATTLWEGWTSNVSRNHHYFSGIGEWLYKTIAGINIDEQQMGFKNTIIKPVFFDGLDYVKAEHETPYGILKVSYTKDGDEVKYNIEIPVGSTAQIMIPKGYILVNSETAFVSGKYKLIFKKL